MFIEVVVENVVVVVNMFGMILNVVEVEVVIVKVFVMIFNCGRD